MRFVSLLLVLGLFTRAMSGPVSRVVNGQVSNPNRWPWQLSLQLDTSHLCGAVVLNEHLALTAAHCLDFAGYATDRFRVVCGAHDILTPDSNWQTSVASELIMHEGYDPNALGFPNDIALVRLSSPLSLNPTCRAVTLPPDPSDPFDDRKAVITGWGRTSGNTGLAQYLKEAELLTLTHSDCYSRWGVVNNPIRTSNICVHDPAGQQGACSGDSGGPLFIEDKAKNRTILAGLSSFARSGCDVSYPSVYTRVTSYLSWIQTYIQA